MNFKIGDLVICKSGKEQIDRFHPLELNRIYQVTKCSFNYLYLDKIPSRAYDVNRFNLFNIWGYDV